MDFEPLYEAWERFKDLIRRCPQHSYQDWFQIQLFYNGLNGQTRTIVDAAAGGTLLSKTADEAQQLLEEMARNNFQWPNERSMVRRAAEIHEVDPIAALSAQVSALSNQFSAWSSKASSSKDSVAAVNASYVAKDDVEQCNYINSRGYHFRPANNLPTHYHPGLRNHENFSYANNRNVLQPPPGFGPPQAENKKVSLEDALASFIVETRGRFNKDQARLDSIETHCSNMGASMKNLEVQIG